MNNTRNNESQCCCPKCGSEIEMWFKTQTIVSLKMDMKTGNILEKTKRTSSSLEELEQGFKCLTCDWSIKSREMEQIDFDFKNPQINKINRFEQKLRDDCEKQNLKKNKELLKTNK
ncbi:hypothetical protein [Acinetobacter baumannii]|uniref:hypothetical protein n=1 Tax=Acinetobacter baumannii TaxID=470 RepID=UPI0011142B65|nr:hypothetical protein [Acinetobacter baumannii]